MKKKFKVLASKEAKNRKIEASRKITASYELLTSEPDPYDLACGDVPVHHMDVYNDVSLDELHQIHEQDIAYGDYTDDPIHDFNQWLEYMIKSEYVRVK